ncbi:hypothetical protein MASR1M8_16060 [Thermomonas brevis]
MIDGTARAWFTALTHGMAWDQGRDAPRIEAAFDTLLATATRWPIPVEFMSALPPQPEPVAIGYERKPASPEAIERARKAVEALAADLVKPVPRAKPERETTPEQRERIEQDLRAHYSGKMAAAGDAP